MVVLFTSYGRIINLSIPLLKISHYPYWKACMKAYIESIGEKAWRSILTGREPPMMVNEKEEFLNLRVNGQLKKNA